MIGIIGLGFVGSAMFKSFKLKKINVVGYDKYNESDSFESVLKTDVIFLCLPTLFDENTHVYNKDAIHEVCKALEGYTGLVVIKSTVEPETTRQLSQLYKLKLVHNPEFLTARTAFEDFHNQKHIVLGKGPNCDDITVLNDLYSKNYPKAVISVCDSLESESMKIYCNSFYASKVMLFNEYYKLCEKNGSDFNTIKDLMLKNNWINEMHTTVPGPDGQFGYGGACFPKDTKALNSYMKKLESPNSVLEAVIKGCEDIRCENIRK
jgi:nucleotide sugar dehydrogenase